MADSSTSGQPKRQSFVTNVIWTWTGVAVNLISALLLSPYVIRKLGSDGYGLWIVVFSLVGYYGLLDMGCRAALAYFTAHFRAIGELDRISTMVSTVTVYYVLATLPLFAAAILFSDQAVVRFRVPEAYRADFHWLLILSCCAFLFGINPFSAVLEGYQRFDISTSIYVTTLVLRMAGSFLLLYLGYGLLEITLNYVVIQVIGITLCYLAVRHLVPNLRWSVRNARLETLRELFSYGIHAFLVGIGQTILNQGTPLVILFFRSPADVGYFGLPQRILQNLTDMVVRVGSITTARATELAATDQRSHMLMLGRYANRYCLMLMMPVVIFVLIYGYELIFKWVGAEFARQSTPLLPVLLLGSAFVTGGQFNSTSLLFSIRKNREYGRFLLLEAAVSFTGIALLLPRYGLIGAAWAVTVPMLLIRGLGTAWLVCRNLGSSVASYLNGIYTPPLLTAIPVYLLGMFIKQYLPGARWPELIAAGALIAASYYGMAAFTCMNPDHRRALIGRILLKTPQPHVSA